MFDFWWAMWYVFEIFFKTEYHTFYPLPFNYM